MEQNTRVPWWKAGAVYQIYPKSFCDSNGDGIGDLEGIRQKLEYIKELGADAIWITPFYPSGGYDNGYDVSDYCAIDPVFGTLEDFKRLVTQAHDMGIRVVIDMVFNHTASDHPWFLESSRARSAAKRDYYIWRDGAGEQCPNNWGTLFGAPAWTKELRQYIGDKMCVGEASGVTIAEALKYARLDGSELSMVFQFEHMDLDGGESFKWNDRTIDPKALKEMLYRWQQELSGKAWNALFWCNHNQPRIVSRLGKESGELWERSAKMLGAALHLMQGTPYIYQGEELGMTNYPFESIEQLKDPESVNAYHEYTENGMFTHDQMMDYIRRKARDNARTPMQWTAGKNAGFSEGKPWMPVNENCAYINAEDQIA